MIIFGGSVLIILEGGIGVGRAIGVGEGILRDNSGWRLDGCCKLGRMKGRVIIGIDF
nr:hypothetical protein [Staphylococcus hominis]